jgi:hypothetical protein
VRRWVTLVGVSRRRLCAEEPLFVRSQANNVQGTRPVTRGMQDMLIATFFCILCVSDCGFMGYDIVNVVICEQPVLEKGR